MESAATAGSKAEQKSSAQRGEESAMEAADPARPAAGQIKLDDSHTVAAYANFCRVTGTPEELIIDFGLNPQPFGTQIESLPISQRLIVNFFTAKRMLAALQMAVARHEQAFGVLETDVQKRVLPSALRQQTQRG